MQQNMDYRNIGPGEPERPDASSSGAFSVRSSNRTVLVSLGVLAIAQAASPKRIAEIADSLGIEERELEQYGHYKAKVARRSRVGAFDLERPNRSTR